MSLFLLLLPINVNCENLEMLYHLFLQLFVRYFRNFVSKRLCSYYSFLHLRQSFELCLPGI